VESDTGAAAKSSDAGSKSGASTDTITTSSPDKDVKKATTVDKTPTSTDSTSSTTDKSGDTSTTNKDTTNDATKTNKDASTDTKPASTTTDKTTTEAGTGAGTGTGSGSDTASATDSTKVKPDTPVTPVTPPKPRTYKKNWNPNVMPDIPLWRVDEMYPDNDSNDTNRHCQHGSKQEKILQNYFMCQDRAKPDVIHRVSEYTYTNMTTLPYFKARYSCRV